MDSTARLIKQLSEAPGVAGYERNIREIVHGFFQPLGEIQRDKIGSIICRKQGITDSPRVMLAAHMDEIGFMVKHITDDGFIKFVPLGGWFDQVLLSQRVTIFSRKGEVVGVIGVKPPHLLSADERNKVVQRKEMYIDIGVSSAAEVEKIGVRVGDPIIPRADFVVMANGKCYLSKAFDDRIGVALIISALQNLQENTHPNTVYGTATVMEEVGLRGATTSVEAVNPDVAIILEADIAGDVPGVKPEETAVKLGKGPSVVLYDSKMIPNLKLRDLVADTATELGIPLQYSSLEGGTTDGSVIHLHKTGVPTIVIAVPARHIHSHSSIIHRSDFDDAVKLIGGLLIRLDENTIRSLTD